MKTLTEFLEFVEKKGFPKEIMVSVADYRWLCSRMAGGTYPPVLYYYDIMIRPDLGDLGGDRPSFLDVSSGDIFENY